MTRIRLFASKKDCELQGVPGVLGAVEKMLEICEEDEVGGDGAYCMEGDPNETHETDALWPNL